MLLLLRANISSFRRVRATRHIIISKSNEPSNGPPLSLEGTRVLHVSRTIIFSLLENYHNQTAPRNFVETNKKKKRKKKSGIRKLSKVRETVVSERCPDVIKTAIFRYYAVERTSN